MTKLLSWNTTYIQKRVQWSSQQISAKWIPTVTSIYTKRQNLSSSPEAPLTPLYPVTPVDPKQQLLCVRGSWPGVLAGQSGQLRLSSCPEPPARRHLSPSWEGIFHQTMMKKQTHNFSFSPHLKPPVSTHWRQSQGWLWRNRLGSQRGGAFRIP